MIGRALVLIVDDDEETLGVLRDALGERWNVATAGTALTALGVWERSRPDAVVLDLRLGDGDDGVDVFQEIRRRLGTRPPAVVVSGAEEAERVARALQVPVLRKPFDLADLLAAVEGLIVPRSGAVH